MTDPKIRSPIPGIEAFELNTEEAAWSQAAHLIAIGLQLDGRQDLLSDLDPAESGIDFLRVAPLEKEFKSKLVNRTIERVGLQQYYSAMLRRRFLDNEPIDSPDAVRNYRILQSRLWDIADKQGSSLAAASMLYVGTESPWEIVRVAAASEVSKLVYELGHEVDILREGCMSQVDTVRIIAANALTNIFPRDEVLRELAPTSDEEFGEGSPLHTSVTIHGTWARFRSTWWCAGSPFFQYLQRNVSPDLYGDTDQFRWTGQYTESARQAAASDLIRWTAKKEVRRFDTIFAHSHGGNVALNAARDGLAIGLLVLMSVPARWRDWDEWEKIEANAKRIVSLRCRFDLAILADRTPQKFNSHPVRELLPPGLWFSHGSILDAQTWEDHNLPSEIKYERLFSQE
jgi:hypothetical protein